MTLSIDAPKGWEHESGYHLNADGKSIEYIADGRYRAIVEAMEGDRWDDSDDLQYCVVVFERQSDGTEGPVEGHEHEFYYGKDEAIEALEDAMQDLQTTITAPVEYYDVAGEVSAIDHNGERYCLDCAREHEDIDVKQYIEEPRTVPAGGPVTIDAEAESRYYCGRCHRNIEMVLIGDARFDPDA